MAKLITLVLLLSFTFALASEINFNFDGLLQGSGYGNYPGNGYYTYSYTPTPSPSPSSQFNLGGITIIVGAANPPYLYPNLTGFTVDLFNLFGEKVNAKIQYVLLADDNSQNGLLNFHVGGFNIFTIPINVVADSTTITAARSAYITFADSYSTSYTTLQIPPALSSTYPSLSSFESDSTAIVGALAGTTNLQTAEDTFCGGSSCSRVNAYSSLSDELTDLTNGVIRGIVSDTPTSDLVVPSGGGSLSVESEAAAFPKDDALVQIFNIVLAEFLADGTLSALRSKYDISG